MRCLHERYRHTVNQCAYCLWLSTKGSKEMYVNWLILCFLVVRPSVCARPQEDVPRRPDVEQCLLATEDSDRRIRWKAAADLAQLDAIDTETIIRIVEIAEHNRNESEIEENAVILRSGEARSQSDPGNTVLD